MFFCTRKAMGFVSQLHLCCSRKPNISMGSAAIRGSMSFARTEESANSTSASKMKRVIRTYGVTHGR